MNFIAPMRRTFGVMIAVPAIAELFGWYDPGDSITHVLLLIWIGGLIAFDGLVDPKEVLNV